MGSYTSDADGEALVVWMNGQCATNHDYTQMKEKAGVGSFDSKHDAYVLYWTMCDGLGSLESRPGSSSSSTISSTSTPAATTDNAGAQCRACPRFPHALRSYDSEGDGRALVDWLNTRCATSYDYNIYFDMLQLGTFDSVHDATVLYEAMCDDLLAGDTGGGDDAP